VSDAADSVVPWESALMPLPPLYEVPPAAWTDFVLVGEPYFPADFIPLRRPARVVLAIAAFDSGPAVDDFWAAPVGWDEPVAFVEDQPAPPPALGHATAPAERPWRGFAIAAACHAAVLVAAFLVIHVHRPAAPPEAPVVALVMEAPPQGNTVVPAIVKPPPAAPMAAKAVISPPAPKPLPPPPVAKLAELPPPAPPVPVAAAPVKPVLAPPALVQGSQLPGAKAGVTTVTVTRPATPDAGNQAPAYSTLSRQLGEQGTVNLSVTVLADGSVGAVKVAKSSGYARLDDAARQALLAWRFQPAVKNGVPVESVFSYWVRFQLQ
jgi:protein TonB